LQSKLSACVSRSNLGNKRTRFTHSLHRMAHTLRHFCSYSSIGTDTRCCSNGAGFLFDITIVRDLLGKTKQQAVPLGKGDIAGEQCLRRRENSYKRIQRQIYLHYVECS
jgi:hypothetical protein